MLDDDPALTRILALVELLVCGVDPHVCRVPLNVYPEGADVQRSEQVCRNRRDRHLQGVHQVAYQGLRATMHRLAARTVRPSYPKACGLRHLAFYVPYVRQTAQEPEDMDNVCEPIRQDEFTQRRMTFFLDPDGLPVEPHEQRVAFPSRFRPYS